MHRVTMKLTVVTFTSEFRTATASALLEGRKLLKRSALENSWN